MFKSRLGYVKKAARRTARDRRRVFQTESLEARFTPSVTSLAVTEIMYHPAAPSAAELAAGFTEADFDFVELQNAGAEAVSLADAALAGGIDFTFGEVVLAPGQFVVVAADVDAFQFRYGTVINVAGAYQGSLGNNGEQIEFQDAMGIAVFSFTFDDGWYTQTDGDGYSLVLTDANSDPVTWGQASAWLASNSVFGSPGRSDGPFDPTPPAAPQNVSAAVVAPSRVDLQWNAAIDPESGVIQYRIHRNGRYIAGTTATQFSDIGVPPNGTYSYAVTAVNASFSQSDFSATATVSLPHVGDQPAFAPAQVAGVVTELVGRETSGIAGSRRNADVFWVHNDGARDRIVAINTFGAALGAITLSDIDPVDVEDIAIGPGPVAGTHYIYLGDIGDNDFTRTSIQIYRFAEPTIDAGSSADQSSTIPGSAIETITLRYPGPAVDAETLLVDPLTGDLFVIVKQAPTTRVYRVAAADLVNGANIVMSLAGVFSFSEPSAGDISPTGREILIRNEDRARLYVRGEGQSVMQALGGPAIVVPVVGQPTEPNGEGIAFDRQGNHYYTISEGRDPTLHYFHRTSRSPGGTSPSVPGDLNGDGLVGLRDLVILRQHFGTSIGATPAQGDMDGNGTVDRGDLAEFTRQYGRTSAVPSPAVPASAVSAARLVASAGTGSTAGGGSTTATGRLQSSRRAGRVELSAVAVDRAILSPGSLTAVRASRGR
jgi:hypothetical protein